MQKLIESFRLKYRQLHHAIRHGDDQLVTVLDREIEPLINRIVNYRAGSSRERFLQLHLICELVREDAGDRPGVRRNMEILTVLLERYFSADKGALDPASQGCRLDGSGEGGADDPTFHQALIDAMPDSVLAVTADHRVIYANAAAAFRHGVNPMAMVGRHIRDFVGRDRQAAEISEAIDACLGDSGRSFSFRSSPSGLADPDLRTIVRAIPTQGRRMGCVLVIEQDVNDI